MTGLSRRSAPGAVRTALLLAGAVLAVGACSSSTDARDTTDGATGAHVAPCARAPGRDVAQLPRLTLPCLTGPGVVEMSHLYGKPEIINIWASWCGPCREEMPMLERAHQRLGDRIQFLGVDVKDSRSSALTFLARHHIGYAQVFDAHGDLPLRLHLLGVPNTLFVDASGAVVYRVIGRLDDPSLAHGLALMDRDLTHAMRPGYPLDIGASARHRDWIRAGCAPGTASPADPYSSVWRHRRAHLPHILEAARVRHSRRALGCAAPALRMYRESR